jgi:tRNA-2-methylthio-N6-dimethylallyladenosine synthase
MFTYSERPGTMAERKMTDDIPEVTKKQRLADIVALQLKHSDIRTKEHLNTVVEVLIEKESKKSNNHWSGRTPQNIVAVFPKEHYKIGDFVNVKVNTCTSATLIGEAIGLSNNN